jgi:hypothetical protein
MQALPIVDLTNPRAGTPVAAAAPAHAVNPSQAVASMHTARAYSDPLTPTAFEWAFMKIDEDQF